MPCLHASPAIHGLLKADMDILYLLIPLSVVLVLLILVGLWWAINSGQFDRIEGEAERILRQD